jgi:hypothetical protein
MCIEARGNNGGGGGGDDGWPFAGRTERGKKETILSEPVDTDRESVLIDG